MPTINIYYKNVPGDKGQELSLSSARADLKSFVAQELTCKDIKLSSEEISIRLICVNGNGMIGSIEIEITASSFEERVKRQDEICLNIARFMESKGFPNTKIWLILSELGHSWQ